MPGFKERFDIALIIPLEEELDEVLEVFGFEADLTTKAYQITELATPTKGIRICLAKQDQMGQASARATSQYLLEKYQIGVLCSLGIAGRLSKDVSLGDVCVSSCVYDLTNKGKITDAAVGAKFEFSPISHSIDRSLSTQLSYFRTNPVLKNIRTGWEDSCRQHRASVLEKCSTKESTIVGATPETPGVYSGPIASFVVSASKKLNGKIIDIDRKMLAIETEAAGVFEAAQQASRTTAIAIRGISDSADAHKNSMERNSGKLIRKIAARNAALYLKAQLENQFFIEYLREHATGTQNSAKESEVSTILRAAESDVDSHLQELCPAHRLSSQGYALPPPRIATSQLDWVYEESTSSESEEIRSTIERHDRIIISVGSNYPDQALPWVIGDHILRTNGDSCYVPMIFEGEAYNSGIVRSLPHGILSEHGITPVIILSNPNLSSKHRKQALIADADQVEPAKFIIVTHDKNSAVCAPDFCGSFNAQMFYARDFSLTMLSDFVSHNFDMDADKAGVIAFRLTNLFERFGMRAHPSYFAGVSQQLLLALLETNTRGELIDLAVGGALMLAVAADPSEVPVSKTFRRQFLTRIIVRQELDKIAVDQVAACKIAQEMADERDIALRPVDFVSAFSKTGTLSFSGECVRFPLSYIRDYLLAQYLTENPDDAERYFQIEEGQFDFNVLDIYAELNPAVNVVNHLSNVLEKDLLLLDERSPETVGFIIDGRVEPRILNYYEKARTGRKLVKKAIEYVGKNPRDLERKQQLIDFRKSLTTRVAAEAEFYNRDEGADDTDGATTTLNEFSGSRILLHWLAGSILIGSGAERIFSSPKRRLAKQIIQLGNRLAEVWTAELAELDFEKKKDDVLASAEFKSMKESLGKQEWKDRQRHFERMLDACEFWFLSHPYRTILSQLGNSRRGNILGPSVRACEAASLFAEITRAVWACDLEPRAAGTIARPVFRKIRNASLLRYLLAEHLIYQVYWDKWKDSEREILLELAHDVVPEVAAFDKRKMNTNTRRKKKR